MSTEWGEFHSDAAGGVTSYAYDKAGSRTRQTDAENRVTLYAYDELNRLKEEKVDAGGGSYLLQRSYAYDKAGHLKTDITGDGIITSAYDDDYNLTGVTDRQNATFSFTYDNNQQQLTARENATGKTVTFGYSPRGLLSQATNANGGSESYSYDGVGNLSQQQDSVSAQSFTTAYAYTPRDQLKTVTKGSDTTSYTFDPAKNLATKSYGNGVVTSYTYNAGNRPIAIQAVKGAQTLQSFSQAYDANSNITAYTEAAGTTSYSYDSLDRLTNENIAAHGNISYTYDKTGNRTTKTEPAPHRRPGACALADQDLLGQLHRLAKSSALDRLQSNRQRTGNGPCHQGNRRHGHERRLSYKPGAGLPGRHQPGQLRALHLQILHTGGSHQLQRHGLLHLQRLKRSQLLLPGKKNQLQL
ncbi:MAG: hypothetical protein ACYCXF_07645 [Thermoleophilia bacterium]